MIEIKTTFQLDGQTAKDYKEITNYFETHGHEQHGYTLVKEPLLHRVTAVKTEQVETL
jgi:hypothetical protein